MFNRILDFLVVPSSSEEETQLVTRWLRHILLSACVILSAYAIFSIFFSFNVDTLVFCGVFMACFGGLFILLNKGYLRLVSLLFYFITLLGMSFAVYHFGGVRGATYNALIIVIIISALFLRGRLTIIATVYSIFTGLFLMWGEINKTYIPDETYLNPLDSWVSSVLTFTLAAVLLGIAARQIRAAMQRTTREIAERKRAEDALREKTNYQAALHETALSIINRLETLPLLESILARAENLANTTHGYIDLLMTDGENLQQIIGHGIFAKLNGTIVLPGEGINGQVLETSEIRVVDNYSTWPHRIPRYTIAGIKAIVAVPLKANGRIIGVIGLAHADPDLRFSDVQIEILGQFADLAALALENAKLYQASKDELAERTRAQEALQRSEENMHLAAQVSRAANANLHLDSLGDEVVDLICKRFNLYYVGLFLVNEEATSAQLLAGSGEAGQIMLANHYSREIGPTSMVGWCIANRQARIALDVGMDAVRFSNPLLPLTRSELALPLISRGQVLGALNVQSSDQAAFSAEDIETFQTMSDQLANAILNARLYTQAEKELEVRKLAEEAVRLLNSELEARVHLRTADLQASEEKFRALSENNPLQIARFDREGRYLYTNRVGRNDLLKPRDVVGKKLRDVLAADDSLVEFSEACIRQVFETGKPLHTEYALDDYYALWLLAPEFGPNGEVITVITSTMDITERKRVEEELQERSLELQAANRELEAFSYSVSHDLRAPLRAIDGFSRILLQDHAAHIPEDAGVYLKRISEAAQNMGQLIDDILRLSRITRTELRRYQVDISAMAESIIKDLVSHDPDRQLEIEIQPNLHAAGDERLLRVALENLLSNAFKFTGKEKNALIKVGAERSGMEKVFHISDNGVGFDMAYSNKLFGAFQRLHNNEEFPGTGIGLAIVQRVIHKHGGRIWCQSEKGKGTTFYFTL